jgi:hypothetical protein
MGMFRPTRKSTPPLRSRQQEIAREEAQLRERLEKLERLVAKGDTGNDSQTQGERRSASGNKADKRLQVSITMDGAQSLEMGRGSRRPRSLRKQRREGQLIFLFLLTALAVAVMWLITHLHS